MSRTVAVLATLDTKGAEAAYLRARIEARGCAVKVVDLGVVGAPAGRADVTRQEVAAAGGTPLEELLLDPSREAAGPVMVRGATSILAALVDAGEVHAVVGLGGTQGTSSCTGIMRALPYGLPKIMVSTVASGDTAPFVGIKDITMMFSVSDILGLNPFTRRVLANAAGAAAGMAVVEVEAAGEEAARPVVGMTNLGVLTEGATRAVALLEAAGFEVIVFHAVGAGGRAMEQMMREGLIGAVFDYALGEIADEVFGGLRAGGPERLTVAAELGLPQVICPGGAEHLGIFVDPPGAVPEAWRGHRYVFHSPVIFVPRLGADEMERVAREIARRLVKAGDRTCVMLPEGGTSRYATAGKPLEDREADARFFEALEAALPAAVEVVRRPWGAEDERFVGEAVERLIALVS